MNDYDFCGPTYPEGAQKYIETQFEALLENGWFSPLCQAEWSWRRIPGPANDLDAAIASVDLGRFSMKLYFSKRQMTNAQMKSYNASTERQLQYVGRQLGINLSGNMKKDKY